MLFKVACHYLRDEEFARLIGATGWSVVAGEVDLECCLSSCTIICACASAKLFRSVDNDPDGSSVVATSAQVESGGEASAGHGELDFMVAAVSIALRDSGVTKSLPAMRTSWSRPRFASVRNERAVSLLLSC